MYVCCAATPERSNWPCEINSAACCRLHGMRLLARCGHITGCLLVLTTMYEDGQWRCVQLFDGHSMHTTGGVMEESLRMPPQHLCLHLLHMYTFCDSSTFTGPAFTTVPLMVISLPR